MKIIFLDMDGVLCTNRAHVAQGYQDMPNHGFMDALDREGVGMLNRIHNKYHPVQYVLSSTWRRFHTRTEMIEWLQRYGWTGEFHPDWATPYLGTIRGEEVKNWLDRHPEVSNYVILDDNSDMREDQKFHFVQTSDTDGISLRNYVQIEKVFDLTEKLNEA